MSHNFSCSPFAYPRLAFGDRRRRRQAASNQNNAASGPPTLEKIANPEALLAGFYRYKAKGRKAPGQDGITCQDIGRSEAAAIAREYARQIRARRWRPQPAKEVQKAKSSGGYRTLRLRVTMDRVVASGLAEALTATLDTYFLPSSFGFRPRKNIWQMLAAMGETMADQNRWTVAVTDIAGAFDHVRIADALEDYRRYVRDDGLIWLIERVLQGHEGDNRTTGIDQGCPFSPLTPLLRLHHCLDLPLHAAGLGYPLGYRYVDDLTFLCLSELEGRQILEQVRQLLDSAGFAPKGTSVVNLRRSRSRIDVLGFGLRREEGGQLRIELGAKAWQNLEEKLEKAHRTPDPTRTAFQAARGWISSLGPAFESGECEVQEGVSRTAARMGFRELGTKAELLEAVRQSRDRWLRLRERVHRSFWLRQRCRESLPSCY
ncbi:reverse transcriptase domain-containing protein [Planctomycetota bacterium]